MSKIANWVFGSFFRTIGRLLVFILLGVIIAHFIDFGSLKDNFSITDLFFDKVSASGIAQSGYANNIYNSSGTALSASNIFGDGVYTGMSASSTSLYFNSSHNNSSGLQISGNSYVNQLQFLVAMQTASSVSQSQESLGVMAIYGKNNSVYSIQFCKLEPVEYEFGKPDNNVGSVIYANLTCPTPVTTENIYLIRLSIQNDSSPDTFQTIHINKNFIYLFNENYILQQGQQDTQNAINQQTQQQQQQHQETMNSTTTEAESEASSFFGDFEDQDFGGLSGIVTAPLNTIRSLLSSTCTNLVLPLPFVNEDLTLPCMTSIYTEHFGAFFTLYQTIILAIVAYRCIRSIFYDVHGFTNPDDDRIEVMDL